MKRNQRPPRAAARRPKIEHAEPEGFWMKLNGYFNKLAKWSAWATGRPTAFILCVLVILVWLITGPIFGFSDTWQLIINTGTTIVTFLMVFLIQNTQNRDMVALQVKLDEIIRCQSGAHNALIDLEDMNDEDLERIREQYLSLARKAHAALLKGEKDIDSPELEELLTADRPTAKSE